MWGDLSRGGGWSCQEGRALEGRSATGGSGGSPTARPAGVCAQGVCRRDTFYLSARREVSRRRGKLGRRKQDREAWAGRAGADPKRSLQRWAGGGGTGLQSKEQQAWGSGQGSRSHPLRSQPFPEVGVLFLFLDEQMRLGGLDVLQSRTASHRHNPGLNKARLSHRGWHEQIPWGMS